MTQSKTLVFFGCERLATGLPPVSLRVLPALIESGYTVAAIVSHRSRVTSRRERVLEVENFAKDHDIPLLLPDKPLEIHDQLQTIDAQAGVLVAYGKIVPKNIIDIFPRGIINIHPSLLPLHRGPTPIESVILSGEAQTGVSLMQLAPEMDAGPVFAKNQINLSGGETKTELAGRLLEVGRDMLIKHLPDILEGRLSPEPQDESLTTYDNLIKKEDGLIDWSKPSQLIERQIRAYAGWPGSRRVLGGFDVIITKARSHDLGGGNPGDIKISREDKTINVQCGAGSLFIESLKPAGKAEMGAEAFLAGYSNKLNF